MITSGMRSPAIKNAKEEVYQICMTGKTIKLLKPATKDEAGEMLTETEVIFKVHPVRFAPFNRKIIQKFAWAENVSLVAYIAKKSLDLKSMKVEDLKSFKKFEYDKKEYELQYAENHMSFGDDFLYVVIGAIVAS